MGWEHAQIIADRTLDARLAERRRTAALLLCALPIGAALVALLALTSAPNLLVYALHISAALGASATLGALELDHERPFALRELALGVDPQDMLSGKLRALAPLALAQGVLLTLPYTLALVTDIAPPGWLFIVTLCASPLGLIAGLGAGALGADRRRPLTLSAAFLLVQLASALLLWALDAPVWLWSLMPGAALTMSMSQFELGMMAGDSSTGFILLTLGTALWATLLMKLARASHERLRPNP